MSLAAIGLTFPVYGRSFRLQQHALKNIIPSEEAMRVHKSAILADGHNDLIGTLREKGISSFENFDLMKDHKELQVDIPRLIKGGVGVQVWVADGYTQRHGNNEASTYCMDDIMMIHKMVEAYPSVFEMAYHADDIAHIREKSRIASLIGIEGGLSIDNSLEKIGRFYDLGARYMTLTWAHTIDWVDSATDEARNNGLSGFGKDVVREMNRVGMMVDISHVSAKSMRDVLSVSKAPVIASHSCAYELVRFPRNIPDDVLKSITKNNGVVMVNFYPGFLTQEGANVEQAGIDYKRKLENTPGLGRAEISKLMGAWNEKNPVPRCSIERVIDHIDHIVKVSGIDHVGIGSDFEGIPYGPDNLEDVSCFPNITQLLMERGYEEDAIRKILGGNFIRVFKEVEKKAGK